jgi:hypothetical protein
MPKRGAALYRIGDAGYSASGFVSCRRTATVGTGSPLDRFHTTFRRTGTLLRVAFE